MRNFIAKAELYAGFEYIGKGNITITPSGDFEYVTDPIISIFSPACVKQINVGGGNLTFRYDDGGSNFLIGDCNKILFASTCPFDWDEGVLYHVKIHNGITATEYIPVQICQKDEWYIYEIDYMESEIEYFDINIYENDYVDSIVCYEHNIDWKTSNYFDGDYQPVDIKNVQEKKTFKNTTVGTTGVFNGSCNLELTFQVVSMKPLVFEDDPYIIAYDNKFHTIAIKSISTTHSISTFEYNISAVVL